MKKYEVIKAYTCVKDRQVKQVGDVVEYTQERGEYLIKLGYVIEVKEKEKANDKPSDKHNNSK